VISLTNPDKWQAEAESRWPAVVAGGLSDIRVLVVGH